MARAVIKSFFAPRMAEVREELARRLIIAGVTVANENQKRLSIGNPYPHDTPSKRGEYPRLRTGFGRAAVTAFPLDLAAVAKDLKILIGIQKQGWYIEMLVDNAGRLGLEKTFADMRPIVAKIIGGGGRS